MEAFATFLGALDHDVRPAWTSDAARSAFDDAMARLRTLAPRLGTEALTRALARAASKASERGASFAHTHLDDLAVAANALAGQETSIARVDEVVANAARAVTRTMRLATVEADEAAQITRVKLLVKTGESEPVLTRYSGAGPLRAFVASVMGQEALRLVKKGNQERPEEDLSELVLPHVAPAAVDAEFLASFKRAFHEALVALDTRERTVLRLTVVDGLTADEVGAGYGVHRVTVARWLRQIREHLLAETRRHLEAELALSRSGLDALLETHLAEADVSLSRVLRETPEGDA